MDYRYQYTFCKLSTGQRGIVRYALKIFGTSCLLIKSEKFGAYIRFSADKNYFNIVYIIKVTKIRLNKYFYHSCFKRWKSMSIKFYKKKRKKMIEL